MTALPVAPPTLISANLASIRTAVRFGSCRETSRPSDRGAPDSGDIVLELRDIEVRDARPIRDLLSLSSNGFALLRHPSAFAGSADHDDLTCHYIAEMGDFVRELTGTPYVLPYRDAPLLRSASEPDTQTFAKPADTAHVDFTVRSAHRVAELVRQWEDPRGTLPAHRAFAIIQTWRVTSDPPHDSLLGVCDARTVRDDDCLALEPDGPDHRRGGMRLRHGLGLRFGRPNPDYAWYYFSNMTRDEVLVFNGFDSRHPGVNNVLHSSISLPGPGATPRRSIEARYCAYFA